MRKLFLIYSLKDFYRMVILLFRFFGEETPLLRIGRGWSLKFHLSSSYDGGGRSSN